MRKHRTSESTVAHQLTAITLSTTAAALLLTFVLLILIEVVSSKRELAANLTATAAIIGINSRAAILYNDFSGIEEILSSLVAKPNVRLAYVFDRQGRPLARYLAAMNAEDGASQIRRGLERYETLGARGGDGVQILHADFHASVFLPVLLEGERIGTIFLCSNQQALWDRLLLFCFGALLVLGGALLLAYLLARRLQRRISRPILDLADKMREVGSQNDFGVRVEIPGEDDLKLLSAGFNDMLSTLAKRNADLADYQHGLERLVAQRTAELQTSHDQLRSANEQLQEARRQAEAASEAKSQFLAHMSHEIRTPLTGILGTTEILQSTPLSREQWEMVHMVHTSGESLLDILNDILDLAKIESGKLELNLAPFELLDVAEGAVGLFAGQAQSKGVALRSQLDPACRGRFLGDAGRLRQILLNLLGNAMKFTFAGTVLLRIWKLEDGPATESIAFEISDTGIGIAPEAQRQIFESFRQEDQSTNRRFGGTGLGLPIVRNLLALMGSDIALESTPGAGSRFSFTISLQRLAMAQDHDESAREEARHFPPQQPLRIAACAGAPDAAKGYIAGRKERILLAEDDATIRKITKLSLRNAGYEITIVTNGREALDVLAKEEFDLLLMDVEMPEVDGLQATRALRAAGNMVPIVGLSAHIGREHALRCQTAGMNDYLSKPYRQADLLRTIAQWLSKGAGQAV